MQLSRLALLCWAVGKYPPDCHLKVERYLNFINFTIGIFKELLPSAVLFDLYFSGVEKNEKNLSISPRVIYGSIAVSSHVLQ